MEVKYDEFYNRYYSINESFVSGCQKIKVHIPESKAPYPYVIQICEFYGAPDRFISLDCAGLKELIEALVKVL
jgi:hypothetical protein